MGAGASTKGHRHHSKRISSPPRESLSPLNDTGQPETPVQDQHFSHEAQNKEMKERVDVARTSTDKRASLDDTLKEYKAKYPDQAEDLETMLERLQALKNFVDKDLNDPEDYAKLGKQTIAGLVETNFRRSESAGTQEEKQFITLIEFTIDVGGAEQLKLFVQHCFKKFSYLIKEESNDEESDDEGETEGYTCYDCLSETLGVIVGFSDFHQGFCSACADAGVISMCFENIKRIDAENPNWEEKYNVTELILNSIGILHNILWRLRDRELFANREQTLLHFAKTKVRTIAALSLLTLAYVVDENTNHLISVDKNLLRFIIILLDEAWQSEDRHSNGFSAKELAEGLSHLAVNDDNKKILGQIGVIPVLIQVIKTSNEDEEKASATRALWMVAFNDNNRKRIRQEEGAMDILHQLQQSKNSEVQKAAAGALWELEGKTARQSSEKIESTGNHVMISYQWDSQEVLVEVKNRLQASGYRVWMDLEQMKGSTLEAMAEAVENASAVLVCVSRRYKESQNCRSEATYAYDLKKDIIPLMMERNYKGDGWLGIIVTGKMWFDFQSKHVLEQSVTKVIKELGGRGKDVDVTDGPSEPVVQAVQSDIVATSPSSLGVSTWTNKEVKQWFKEIGLEKVCKEDISEINGQTLIDLQQVRSECPEYFYRCLEKNLNLSNMVDVFTFRKELGKLLGY